MFEGHEWAWKKQFNKYKKKILSESIVSISKITQAHKKKCIFSGFSDDFNARWDPKHGLAEPSPHLAWNYLKNLKNIHFFRFLDF